MKKNAGIREPEVSRPGSKTTGMREAQVGSRRKKSKIADKGINAVGVGFIVVQFLATVLFEVFLWRLGVLPAKYFGLITAVVAVALLLVIATQFAKKKGARVFGRVVAVLSSLAIVFMSYYVIMMDRAIENLTSDPMKVVHSMAVAVNTDDPALTIQDAAGYVFGVQYQLNPEQTEATIADINRVLGREIGLAEYDNISEQIVALHNREIGAIIFNEAYNPIVDEEEFSGFEDTIRIIYFYAYEEGSFVSTKPLPTPDPSETLTPTPTTRPKTPDLVSNDCFSVYLSGIDTYGSIGNVSRSDSNIIAVVNPVSRQILLITTPRDYYVTFPGVTGGSKDKLTHAGLYGVEVSMATLSELYNLPIEYYARVNFNSFMDIVDILGGVDVYSSVSLTMGKLGEIVKGMNHFNGAQALAFSRERIRLAGGDSDRGKNQQAVITAMLQKMMTPSILTSATSIMTKVGDSVETNFTSEQIQRIVADQLDAGSSWNITSIAATGRGDTQYCYSYRGKPLYVTWPNIDSLNEIKGLVQKVMNGEVIGQ